MNVKELKEKLEEYENQGFGESEVYLLLEDGYKLKTIVDLFKTDEGKNIMIEGE